LERPGWEGENPQRVVVPNDDGDGGDDDDVFECAVLGNGSVHH